jgi:hypothetical protein
MTRAAALAGTGKPAANRTKAEGREHGTRHKTGVPQLLTPELVRSYSAKGFNMPQIADLIGCFRNSVRNAIVTDDELKDAWKQGQAELLEKTTSSLMNLLDSNNLVATLFTLKAKFGWVEEQYKLNKPDLTNSPRVNIYLPHNDRDNNPGLNEEENEGE